MGVDKSAPNPSGLPDHLRLLVERFPDAIHSACLSHGDAAAAAAPAFLRNVMEYLKGDENQFFNVLLDMTAVDYLGREPRFEVVYHLLSLPRNQRLRIKVGVPGTEPVLESVTGLWKSADWLEREIWDMFGIRFEGHPNLKRILLYPEFQGHPLRKDYPIRRRQPLIGPKN